MEYLYNLMYIRTNIEYYGDQKLYIRMVNALC